MDHYVHIYAKGEEEFPSFDQWMEQKYEDFMEVHSIKVAERYRSLPYVASVDILNMHEVAQSGDLIEHFFCQYLRAEAVCKAIKEGAKPSKSNIGAEHEWERLAIKAKFAGKITTDLTRPLWLDRSSRKMKAKVEEMSASAALPKRCPNRTLLEQAVQTEIDHERTYFPEWFESQGGEDGLRKSFTKAVDKKFCSLDVEKVFASGVLDSVFKEFG